MNTSDLSEHVVSENQTLGLHKRQARLTPIRMSIKQRLPLLIGILLLGVIAASILAAYQGMKNIALDAESERLRLLTKQLSDFIQQTSAVQLSRTATLAGNPAVRNYLKSPQSDLKQDVISALQPSSAQPDQNALDIELWNANHTIALIIPEGSPQTPSGLETEFSQTSTTPTNTAMGEMRIINDKIVFPIVAAVKDDNGRHIGYLVRWRKVLASPEARKQFMDLLGANTELYLGNTNGEVWSDLVTKVAKPPVDVRSNQGVVSYKRDNKPSVMALGRAVPGTPWLVLVEIPTQAMFAQANKFLRWMIIVGSLLLIIGLSSAFLLSRSITTPLQSLTEASTEISKGNYSQLVNVHRDDELGELARSFNTMVIQVRDSQKTLEQKVKQRTAQLETVNKELEAFSYSVSHDLRAPLRAINGFSRILLDNYSQMPDDAKRYLDLVCTNAQQMGRLIDDLLGFSRLGRQQMKKQEVSPNVIVGQVLDELQQEKQERHIDIKVDNLPSVQADPSLLKQVYTNLISNAIKYSRGTDKAEIKIGSFTNKEQNNETVYYVKDNGTGFDMQYAHKLFGVFQRLHRIEDYEGTGVGLAIVQHIVNRHGGRIWAEAEVGKGATFYFTLQGDNLND